MLLHSQLIHPEINGVLGQAGHHSKVLICDGNYPASSKIGPEAELVSLNLSPGVVTCSQVLRALVTAIPLDAVNTMGIPADDPYAKHGPPPVWAEYEQILEEAKLDGERTSADDGHHTETLAGSVPVFAAGEDGAAVGKTKETWAPTA